MPKMRGCSPHCHRDCPTSRGVPGWWVSVSPTSPTASKTRKRCGPGSRFPTHWYGEPHRPVEVLSQTAVWYSTGFPPVPIRWVLIRDPRGTFRTQALLCTALDADPQQIRSWFVRRWQLEVTFHEVRAHLGVETQRQWVERAILRTTPALLGLFSLVTLQAYAALSRSSPAIRQSAWYAKAGLLSYAP